MKNVLLIPALFLAIQAFAGDPARQAVIEQAKLVGEAFMQKDYAYVIDKTYPALLIIGGGRDQLIDLTKSQMEDIESDDLAITSFKVTGAEKIIKGKKEWFCVVNKKLILDSPEMTIATKGCLIGVTSDEGKNWSFVDCAGVTNETIDLVFEKRPKRLTIPAKNTPNIKFKDSLFDEF